MKRAIENAIESGALHPVHPVVPWAVSKRELYVCRPLKELLHAGRESPDPGIRGRMARLEAALSFFVEGGRVDENFLKHLDPPKYEHWEIRSRRPRPSLRVFGRFVDHDVFVATPAVARSELGGKWSPRFEHEKLVCEQYWSEAGLSRPFTDAPSFRYEAYMSNAARTREIPP
jgi:hypothetical protein